jgi:assimilatory nitrate reductase catalytic subunit
VSNPATDPHSGQPELKHVPARLARETAGWEATLITRRDIRPIGFVHWSRSAVEGGWLYDLTGTETADQGILLARALLAAETRRIEYTDRSGRSYRAAAVDADGALVEALFVAPPRLLPNTDWMLNLLASDEALSPEDRRGLLSGRAPKPMPSKGRIVCSCFGVGVNQIAAAIAGGCASVEAVGGALSAGTNCGSCIPEIRGILNADRLQAAE